MRIIDWSSDVCFSDLSFRASTRRPGGHLGVGECARTLIIPGVATPAQLIPGVVGVAPALRGTGGEKAVEYGLERQRLERLRSEEHTSELQSLMRISYDVFCLKTKTIINPHNITRAAKTLV